MNKYLYLMGIIVGVLSQNVIADASYSNSAKATLYNAAGKAIGKVEFSQQRGGIKVEASVSGLTPGFHGFHIHAAGACVTGTPPFTSALGHFKVGNTTHKDHNGDFPVLLANTNGIAKTEFVTDRFKIKDLFDADGSAVIVHANPDNYANIPAGYTPASVDVTNATQATGDAGARFACGVVSKK